MSDDELFALARDLHDRGKINPLHYRVWAMHRYGYTFGQIREMFLAEQIATLKKRIQTDPHGGDKTFDEEAQRGIAEMTICRWYHRTQHVIEKEEDRRKEGMPRLGVTGEIGGEVEFLFDTVVAKTLKKTG